MAGKLLAVAALLLSFTAVAEASSFQTQAHLRVRGGVTFHGSATMEAGVIGGIHDYRMDASPPHFQATVHGAWYQLIDFPDLEVHADNHAPSGPFYADTPRQARVLEQGWLNGTLALVNAYPDASLRFTEAQPTLAQLEAGTLAASPPLDLRNGILGHADVAYGTPLAYSDVPQRQALLQFNSSQELSLQGGVHLTLAGAHLAFHGEDGHDHDFVTGQHPAADATDPTGNYRAGPMDNIALFVDAPQATLDLGAPASWSFSVTQLRGQLGGDVALAQANGDGTVNQTQIPASQHLFQLIGEFTADTRFQPDATDWRLEGNASFAAVNAQPVAGVRPGWGAAATLVAGAGVLALLAALLAKAWRSLPEIFGRNVARPLAGERRRKILSLVAQSPGIGQNALAIAVGSSRATVRHHLRVLLRAQFVSEHEVGGQHTYTLNSQSFEFRVGQGAATAAQGLALLQHAVRGQLLALLQKEGDLDAAGLQKRWAPLPRHASLAPDTISYHLGRLAEAGMVSRAAQAGRTVWHAEFNPGQSLDHQRKAFLARNNLAHLAAVLELTPLPREELLRRLAKSGRRPSARLVQSQLDLLVVCGYARQDGLGRFSAA